MDFVKRWLWVAPVAIALLLVVFFMVRCGFFHIPLHNITVNPDTEKPFVVQPKRVIYTPKPTKENPKPTPEVIDKPIEGKVEFIPATDTTPAKIKVQEWGFTCEPKAGAVWCHEDINFFAGARVVFVGEWGLEVGGLLKRDGTNPQLAVGIDRRLLILSNITVSGGIATNLTSFAPYIGAEVVLLTL